jgi:hypothetical protein
MAALASAQPQTERVAFSRLLWVGPLAIVAAAVANMVIQRIAAAALQPDPGFGPLTPMPPILFSVIGVLGAVIVYALIGRFSRRPIALFRRVALIVLIVSIIPDLLLFAFPSMPGTTIATIAVLILMHIVAWAIAVGLLTRFART